MKKTKPNSKNKLENLIFNFDSPLTNQNPKPIPKITYYNLAGRFTTSERKFIKYMKKEIQFYQNKAKANQPKDDYELTLI